MGNSAPAPKALSEEQQDLQFLGERHPFGDAEFRHLYTAYRRWWLLVQSSQQQGAAAADHADFLLDWGGHCGSAQQHLRTVVDDCLPRHFGNALFQAAFSAPGDVTIYHRSGNGNGNARSGNGGRRERGGEGKEGEKPATASAGSATATVDDRLPEDEERVSARQLVEIGYRISLAVAHLQKAGKAKEEEGEGEQRQQQQEQQEQHSASDEAKVKAEAADKQEDETTSAENNVAACDASTASDLPKSSSSDANKNQNNHNNHHAADDSDDRSLAALAQSLVEKGRRRRQRSNGFPGYGTATTECCPHLQNGRVELADVLEWSEHTAPMFASLLPTLFQYLMFPNQPAVGGTRTLFEPPRIDDDNDNNNKDSSAASDVTSSFFRSSASARLFALACTSPALTGQYHRLYTSAADGLSFNRLQNAVLGYGGPTLLLVRSASGGIFGAFTATPWKECKDFYGNTDCFLYQLQPATAVYRPTGNERNYMYCNSAARSRGYDQQAHGIGFGGTIHEPRLFLAETLDDCVAAATDLTFENGRLLPEISVSADGKNNGNDNNNAQQQHRKYFAVDSLEVWGAGGTAVTRAALERREAARAVTQEAIRRARKVDKAQFLDDFRAGTFASKAFKHRQEADGRANDDLDGRCRDKDQAYEYA